MPKCSPFTDLWLENDSQKKTVPVGCSGFGTSKVICPLLRHLFWSFLHFPKTWRVLKVWSNTAIFQNYAAKPGDQGHEVALDEGELAGRRPTNYSYPWSPRHRIPNHACSTIRHERNHPMNATILPPPKYRPPPPCVSDSAKWLFLQNCQTVHRRPVTLPATRKPPSKSLNG